MVKRGELTDEAWARIAPLLPENGRRGGRWRDHREVVNGILWKLRTGAPWRDLPERYGPWQICYDRFRGPLLLPAQAARRPGGAHQRRAALPGAGLAVVSLEPGRACGATRGVASAPPPKAPRGDRR